MQVDDDDDDQDETILLTTPTKRKTPVDVIKLNSFSFLFVQKLFFHEYSFQHQQ